MVEVDRTDDVLEQGSRGPALHGFQCIDEVGTIISVSRAEQEWLGYRTEDLVDKNFEDLLTEKDRVRFRRKHKSGNTASNIEVYDLVRKDRSHVTIAFRPFEVVKLSGGAKMIMATTMNLSLLRQEQECKAPKSSEPAGFLAPKSNIVEFSSMSRRTKPECPTLHRMPLHFRNVANANRPNTDVVGENNTYFENCPLSKVLSDCLDHLSGKAIIQEKQLTYDVSIMHSSKILVNQRVMELVLLNLLESVAILALPHAQLRILCHRSDSTFQVLIKSFRRVDWTSVAEYYTAGGSTLLTPVFDLSLDDDMQRVDSRLSMCREIVGTFGGQVRSEYVGGPYATFVVQMPVNKP